jgi:hypothetical protein
MYLKCIFILNMNLISQQKIIEYSILLFLLFIISRTKNSLILIFSYISIFMHISRLFKLYQTGMYKISKSITNKIFFLLISIILLIYCLQSNDEWIIMFGLFVFFSKILDFYSENDSTIEEIFTLIISFITTKLIVNYFVYK